MPRNPDHLPAVWAFCSSAEFSKAVRQLNPGLYVTNATLLKVSFDFERWEGEAAERYPEGLPAAHSDDPREWLFDGQVVGSDAPLQAAVARLLGFSWPPQKTGLIGLAGSDGIVPLPAVAGKESAAERLRAFLAVAFGDAWSPAVQEQLLVQAGFGGKGLDLWLRDGFFEQHCKLFHQRPFIWHIWDGRKDGFSALVNYHTFDAARLDALIYTYLVRNWIGTQRAARDQGVAGAEGRLVAALELQKKLEAIRDGEEPLDIFVRWKPLERQPIGWEPDVDDGVRLNIRPFVMADVLRSRVNVNWNKDRGLNPDGSQRLNDTHLKRVEKLAARKAAGR